MRFGVLPPYGAGVAADPAWMTAFARQAEACGFESLYAVEHVVVVRGYASRYPYSDTGRMPLPDDCDIPDPLELIAFLAGATTTLRFGTGILILPEHHPVQLAKRLATIDRLSGGRLTLGVGVGWLREELEAVGVDVATRGERAEEAIVALRALWAGDAASHHGRFFDFDRVCSNPKPLQQGGRGVPVHVGGHSRAAARRAGRLGDGFHPLGVSAEALPGLLADMRRAADAAGRDAGAIELTLGGLLTALDDDGLARAEAQGADRLVLSTRQRQLDLALEELRSFADRFIAGGRTTRSALTP